MEKWIKDLMKKYISTMGNGGVVVLDMDVPDLCREAYEKGVDDAINILRTKWLNAFKNESIPKKDWNIIDACYNQAISEIQSIRIKEHKNTYSTLADLCSEAYKKGKKDGYEEALNEVRMLSNDEELNQIILNKLMES